MTTKIPGPAYRVETERLVFRCWTPGDAPLLKAAIDASLEHLRPWMPWANDEPQSLQQKIELLRTFRGMFDLWQDFIYGIFDRSEGQVLGGTGLHPRVGEGAREIGYWVHVDYTSRGIASEAAGALTRVAFEVDRVRRVEIHCAPENVRSAAVPRKLGFTHEATLRKRVPDSSGGLSDSMIWTMLEDEYPGSPAARTVIQAYDAIGRRIL